MANNPTPHGSSSAPTDRKLVERNRRNQMKALYSNLYSLVPHQISREAKTLPDQLEDATNYITMLKANLEKLKEKREELLGMEEPKGIIRRTCSESKSRLLQVEVHQVGSSMEVVLVTGSDYHFVFRQTLLLLQEEGAEIVNVNQSMFADRVFHKIIAEVVGDGMAPGGSDGARICERVKKFVSQYKDGQH